LRLSEPARPVSASAPGQPTEPGGQSQFGDTVARDLVNAQIDLLNVENDFLSVWVDHEVQEINLDYLLGTMELDGRGIRIEHNQPYRTYLTHLPDTAPFEEPMPCGFLGCDEAALNGASGASVGDTTGEELPRPSPQLRQPEGLNGPAFDAPSTQPGGAELLPPPVNPGERMQ
jgi:hypothetical protein